MLDGLAQKTGKSVAISRPAFTNVFRTRLMAPGGQRATRTAWQGPDSALDGYR
jgi:hypothetical protein